jgi:DNA-binding transcriptional MocR family regulator
LIRQLVLCSVGWAGPLAASEFVITNSCTEALALCLRAVTHPGDTVAVESPGYYLMLQLLESLGLRALEIPTDPHTGLSIEALDLATRESRVAACLLVANASNPLGSIMPDEHKRRLAKLDRRTWRGRDRRRHLRRSLLRQRAAVADQGI